MRTLRAVVAVLLMVTTASCVSRRVDINAVDYRKPVQVRSAVKAHLKDGSTIVYPSGVTVTATEVQGAGTRYPFTGSGTSQVSSVPVEEIVGMESYRAAVTGGEPFFVTVLGTAATVAATGLLAIALFGSCPTVYSADGQIEEAELFSSRRVTIGDGITGWVIANGRSMCNASPELDMVGVADEIVKLFRGVLVSPLLREDGAFGAIALYSQSRTSYSTEHVRLLESVCQHASSALNNALTYEKTRESALVDPLTELPNARGFYMMLEQRIAECQRMNRESLSVICMDIDDFKIINDKYGHSTGDRLLASVAGVVRHELRQMDILTRYAGDEFVAFMPMASGKMAESIADRIRNAVEEQLFSVRTGTLIGLGVSLGVGCFPDDGETSEELLTAAARRMQRDKHARKTILTVAGAGVSSIDMMT